MKISFIIASVKLVDEIIPLIRDLLSQRRSFDSLDAQVILVSGYSYETDKMLRLELGVEYKDIIHIKSKDDVGYLGKFNLALKDCRVIDSDFFVFMSDDILVPGNFVSKISSFTQDRAILYAPLISDERGNIELSVFRKKYSKSYMFFRYYDGGVYTKIADSMSLINTTPEDINNDRQTVFGCVFIMNSLALAQMLEFDTDLYLYYEEVFLYGQVKKFNWECKVVRDINVIHKGSGTLTKRFTLERGMSDIKSAVHVAKKYLGFNRFQLCFLILFKIIEFFSRRIVETCRFLIVH